LINYFWILLWLGITINPFIALTILFLTFGIAYLLSLRFYDLLAENL
jgi:hypothetical protein